MCTVTYIPRTTGYFLTSNRDEKSTRSTAILPKAYTIQDVSAIYPKDVNAGGTWITLKENGDSLCLLNGAFTNFIDTGFYTISRGQIVLQIAAEYNLLSAFSNINLQATAPFTLIIIQHLNIYECRWDGQKKYCKALHKDQSYIWSSATLYDDAMQSKRKNWFEKWQAKQDTISQKNIIAFHKNTGDGDVANDLVMNRNNTLFTVSITSIQVDGESFSMEYNDIIHDSNTTVRFANEAVFNS
jgi:Transport and Golgi organisation 2